MKQTPASSKDWRSGVYAEQYFDCERRHLDSALRQAAGPAALQLGDILEQMVVDDLDLPCLFRLSSDTGISASPGSDLFADAAFLPFPEKSLTTVLLPHVLEQHSLPHQVLREAHRVLQPEGHLVLSGFNPYSLIGLQNKIFKRAVLKGQYYSSKRVTDWLQLLGFEVVGNAMYQYAPLSKNQRTRKALNFLEAGGSRWFPMFSGAYMITAKKKDVGMTMIGRVKYRTPKRKFATAPAKVSLKLNQSPKSKP